MAQQPNVEIAVEEKPSAVPEPGPARSWEPRRPGDDIGPDQPWGGHFGRTGPNTGYALRLIAQADFPRDHRADEVEAVVGTIAGAHVLGYTCANDVTARDLQRADGQWTRAKGFDTFCPLGPAINTEFDPLEGMAITTSVNGELRQEGSTADLVFGVAELIAFISRVMTLLPGDVVLTGTPAGVGPVVAGDLMEVEIEGIGVLANPVAGGPSR